MFPQSRLEQKLTPVLQVYTTLKLWYKDTTKLSVKLYYHTLSIIFSSDPDVFLSFALHPPDNPLAHEIWNFVQYLQQTSFV